VWHLHCICIHSRLHGENLWVTKDYKNLVGVAAPRAHNLAPSLLGVSILSSARSSSPLKSQLERQREFWMQNASMQWRQWWWWRRRCYFGWILAGS
jgi:hypothetical protein